MIQMRLWQKQLKSYSRLRRKLRKLLLHLQEANGKLVHKKLAEMTKERDEWRDKYLKAEAAHAKSKLKKDLEECHATVEHLKGQMAKEKGKGATSATQREGRPIKRNRRHN